MKLKVVGHGIKNEKRRDFRFLGVSESSYTYINVSMCRKKSKRRVKRQEEISEVSARTLKSCDKAIEGAGHPASWAVLGIICWGVRGILQGWDYSNIVINKGLPKKV